MSDQRMPEMTGVELLQRAKAIRPEITRLLFTAHAEIRTVIDAINQGTSFATWPSPGTRTNSRRSSIRRSSIII